MSHGSSNDTSSIKPYNLYRCSRINSIATANELIDSSLKNCVYNII